MNLLRSFVVVGGFTALSRLLGFFRDMLIAATLGAGAVSDAFFVAFRFPNLFRRLFAEGAFNSAFVPIFAGRLEVGGKTAARLFGEQALSILLVTLLVFTALAEISMPLLLRPMAPGFVGETDKYDLAVLLTRVMFPYLVCMSLGALLSGVLNAFGRFAAAAAAPVLLNVVLIVILLFLYHSDQSENSFSGLLLSFGVTFAGFLQLGMLWVASRRTGIALGLRRPVWSADMTCLLRRAVPGIISAGVTQINLVIGTAIASLQASAVSYLYYAERVYQLPLGVVGIAIGIVLLPELSRHLQAGRLAMALNRQKAAIEFSMLLTFPAAILCFELAIPIIDVLFRRGAFGDLSVQSSASALAAFSVGLPSFVLIKVLLPFFFAREDTKTPMWCAFINVVVNIGASLLLYVPFAYVGIAIATSLSGWLNVILLSIILFRRGYLDMDKAFAFRCAGLTGASLLLAFLLVPVSGWIQPLLGSGGEFSRFFLLGSVCLLAFSFFLVCSHCAGAVNLRQIRDSLFRREQ